LPQQLAVVVAVQVPALLAAQRLVVVLVAVEITTYTHQAAQVLQGKVLLEATVLLRQVQVEAVQVLLVQMRLATWAATVV
jgi:hypothetical protein